MIKGHLIPKKMLSQDAYSQWLGIEILECEIGRCKVGMTIRKDMLNSMNKAHGGISYSLTGRPAKSEAILATLRLSSPA